MKESIRKNWAIIALTVALAISCLFFGIYATLYTFEKSERKRQYAELLDVRGELHGLEEDYEFLQVRLETNEAAFNSSFNRCRAYETDFQAFLDGDFAVFNIKGTAKVRELEGDEVYDIDINEHHPALSPTTKNSSPYRILHGEDIVEISLEITTPNGVLYINNEEINKITDIGTYNVMIVGSGGYHTATLVVGGYF